jgi:Flp pilus assembly protein TadG
MQLATRRVTWGRHRGAAAAEFALMSVPLTILLLGTIDVCRVFYHYTTVTNCARNAAIWASDPYSNTVSQLWGNTTPLPSQSPYASVQQAAVADASNLSPVPTVSDPVYASDSNGYTTVSVTVTYNLSLFSGFLLGNNGITIARSVTMRAAPPIPVPTSN